MPGPGGSAVNFFRTFTYAGVPLSTGTGQQTLQSWIVSTSAVQKIHAADLIALTRCCRESLMPTMPRRKPRLICRQQLRSDPMPLVSGWANFVSAGLARTAEEAHTIADGMASSPQWSTRLLSLLAGGAVPRRCENRSPRDCPTIPIPPSIRRRRNDRVDRPDARGIQHNYPTDHRARGAVSASACIANGRRPMRPPNPRMSPNVPLFACPTLAGIAYPARQPPAGRAAGWSK